MESFKHVIIGGGIASQRACDGIRRTDEEGPIALVTAENHLPYQRPPLSKGYLTGKEGLDHVILKGSDYYDENGVRVIRGVRAESIDAQARSVSLANGRSLGYEVLLLSTGGHAWRLPLPGNDLGNVCTLRTIEDCDAIRQLASAGKRALVLGGSFIGSEVASSLSQLGPEVVMVFPEARLLARVAPEHMSEFLRARYEAEGVRILTGTRPQRLEGRDKVERAVLDDGSTLDVDLVVMGVGIRLNTELARDAGLQLSERGAVVVDQYLRTSDPNIYAAGDIAEWPDRRYGKRLRVEHWDVARRQGLGAGRNMAGEGSPYRSLPYFFSDLFDLSFEVWGDLTAWDETVMRGNLEAGSCAFYYFDRGQMAGVLAMGRPDQERQPMQDLVSARPAYADVAPKLADEGVSLEELVS